MFIAKICDLFKRENIPFAIVGGYAVAIHGVARGTFDLDIITEISEANFAKIDQTLRGVGMEPLLPVKVHELFANLDTYIKERNLVAWNFRHPTRMRDSLDIIVTEDMRNYNIVEVESDFGLVPTLSLESLIQMKSRAGREQDQKDVAALKQIKAGKR